MKYLKINSEKDWDSKWEVMCYVEENRDLSLGDLQASFAKVNISPIEFEVLDSNDLKGDLIYQIKVKDEKVYLD